MFDEFIPVPMEQNFDNTDSFNKDDEFIPVGDYQEEPESIDYNSSGKWFTDEDGQRHYIVDKDHVKRGYFQSIKQDIESRDPSIIVDNPYKDNDYTIAKRQRDESIAQRGFDTTGASAITSNLLPIANRLKHGSERDELSLLENIRTGKYDEDLAKDFNREERTRRKGFWERVSDGMAKGSGHGMSFEDMTTINGQRSDKTTDAFLENDIGRKMRDESASAEEYIGKMKAWANDELKQLADNKQNALLRLEANEAGAWTKIVNGAISNAGYMGEFMLPLGAGVAFAASATERRGELGEKRYDVDNNGNLVIEHTDERGWKAIGQAAVGAGVEVGVEMVGGKLVGLAGKGVYKPLTKAIGKGAEVIKKGSGEAVENALTQLGKKYAWLSEKTQFQGILEEMAEENLQGFADDVLGLGKRKSDYEGFKKELNNFFEDFGEKQVDIFLGLIGTMAAQGGAVAGYNEYVRQHNNGIYNRVADPALKRAFTDEQMKEFSPRQKMFLRNLTEKYGLNPERAQKLIEKFEDNAKMRDAVMTLRDLEQPYFDSVGTNLDGVDTGTVNGHSGAQYGGDIVDRVLNVNQQIDKRIANGNTVSDAEKQATVRSKYQRNPQWGKSIVGGQLVLSNVDEGTGIALYNYGKQNDGTHRIQVVNRDGHKWDVFRDNAEEAFATSNDIANRMSIHNQLLDARRDQKRMHIEDLINRTNNVDNFVIYDTMADLVAEHPDARNTADFDYGNHAATFTNPKDGSKVIALVLDNIKSSRQAAQKIFHEAALHAGLDKIFKTEEAKYDWLMNIDSPKFKAWRKGWIEGKGKELLASKKQAIINATKMNGKNITEKEAENILGKEEVNRLLNLTHETITPEDLKTPEIREALDETFAWAYEVGFRDPSMSDKIATWARGRMRKFGINLKINETDANDMVAGLFYAMKDGTGNASKIRKAGGNNVNQQYTKYKTSPAQAQMLSQMYPNIYAYALSLGTNNPYEAIKIMRQMIDNERSAGRSAYDLESRLSRYVESERQAERAQRVAREKENPRNITPKQRVKPVVQKAKPATTIDPITEEEDEPPKEETQKRNGSNSVHLTSYVETIKGKKEQARIKAALESPSVSEGLAKAEYIEKIVAESDVDFTNTVRMVGDDSNGGYIREFSIRVNGTRIPVSQEEHEYAYYVNSKKSLAKANKEKQEKTEKLLKGVPEAKKRAEVFLDTYLKTLPKLSAGKAKAYLEVQHRYSDLNYEVLTRAEITLLKYFSDKNGDVSVSTDEVNGKSRYIITDSNGESFILSTKMEYDFIQFVIDNIDNEDVLTADFNDRKKAEQEAKEREEAKQKRINEYDARLKNAMESAFGISNGYGNEYCWHRKKDEDWRTIYFKRPAYEQDGTLAFKDFEVFKKGVHKNGTSIRTNPPMKDGALVLVDREPTDKERELGYTSVKEVLEEARAELLNAPQAPANNTPTTQKTGKEGSSKSGNNSKPKAVKLRNAKRKDGRKRVTDWDRESDEFKAHLSKGLEEMKALRKKLDNRENELRLKNNTQKLTEDERYELSLFKATSLKQILDLADKYFPVYKEGARKTKDDVVDINQLEAFSVLGGFSAELSNTARAYFHGVFFSTAPEGEIDGFGGVAAATDGRVAGLSESLYNPLLDGLNIVPMYMGKRITDFYVLPRGTAVLNETNMANNLRNLIPDAANNVTNAKELVDCISPVSESLRGLRCILNVKTDDDKSRLMLLDYNYINKVIRFTNTGNNVQIGYTKGNAPLRFNNESDVAIVMPFRHTAGSGIGECMSAEDTGAIYVPQANTVIVTKEAFDKMKEAKGKALNRPTEITGDKIRMEEILEVDNINSVMKLLENHDVKIVVQPENEEALEQFFKDVMDGKVESTLPYTPKRLESNYEDGVEGKEDESQGEEINTARSGLLSVLNQRKNVNENNTKHSEEDDNDGYKPRSDYDYGKREDDPETHDALEKAIAYIMPLFKDVDSNKIRGRKISPAMDRMDRALKAIKELIDMGFRLTKEERKSYNYMTDVFIDAAFNKGGIIDYGAIDKSVNEGKDYELFQELAEILKRNNIDPKDYEDKSETGNIKQDKKPSKPQGTAPAPAQPPPALKTTKTRKTHVKTNAEIDAALDAFDDIKWSSAKVENVLWSSAKIDTLTNEQRIDLYGKTLNLVTALNEAGYKKFADMVSILYAKKPEAFEKVRPYLRGVWNTIAEELDLEEVSKKDVEEIYNNLETEDKDTTDDQSDNDDTSSDENSSDLEGRDKQIQHAAMEIAAWLKQGKKLTNAEVVQIVEKHFKDTITNGKFSVKDVRNVLELGVNMRLKQMVTDVDDSKFGSSGLTNGSVKDAVNMVKTIRKHILDLIPTETNRTTEQIKAQQFSTPPTEAFVAAWVANIKPGEVMLEPSAGIGGLAVFAKCAGANVILNEYEASRGKVLNELGITNYDIFNHDAGNMNVMYQLDMKNGKIPSKPTVVVMNPPFSSNIATGKKDTVGVGGKHVEEALKLLQPGGRLVAIVGGSMDSINGSQSSKAWLSKIGKEYAIRANIQVNGQEYSKYGTSYDNNILVIDKVAPGGETLTGRVENLEELPIKLERVRAMRGNIAMPQNNGNQDNGSNDNNDGGKGVNGGGHHKPPRGGKNGGGHHKPPRVGKNGTKSFSGGKSRKVKNNVVVDNFTKPADCITVKFDYKSAVAENNAPSKSDKQMTDPAAIAARAAMVAWSSSKAEDEMEMKADSLSPVVNALKEQKKADFYSFCRVCRDANPEKYEQFKEMFGRIWNTIAEYDEDIAAVAEDELTNTLNEVDKLPITEYSDEIGDGTFTEYVPSNSFAEARTHVTPLVESAAMASVPTPQISYELSLGRNAILNGQPSGAQLEAMGLACQAMERDIVDERGETVKGGFLLGDGTGCGKGTMISGIISNYFNKGLIKKAVWFAPNPPLFKDAVRDMATYGNQDLMFEFNPKNKSCLERKTGVAFCSYGAVATGTTLGRDEHGEQVISAKPGKKSMMLELGNWLGKDYDGLIVLDESHMVSNVLSVKGARGAKKPSARAEIMREWVRMFPKARVLYVSATSATEAKDMAYLERLGLWGDSDATTFKTAEGFTREVGRQGLAVMEVVARDMKAMGVYIARTLSMEGTSNRTLVHEMSEDEIADYNRVSDVWQMVRKQFKDALVATGATRARTGAMSQYYGQQQAFFNQYLTGIKSKTIVADAKKAYDRGECPVFQIVNTNDAQAKRQEKEAQMAGEELDPDAMDLSPKEILIQLIHNSYPITMYEEIEDENGAKRSVMMTDADGKPLISPEMEQKRDDLIMSIQSMDMGVSVIDVILDTFGADKVAEITGRSQRYIVKRGEDVKTKETRTDAIRDEEAKDFNNGKRRVLIFSKSGGTGRSYHADKRFPNHARRIHYLVQAGWRAADAVQGFGRTLRTNQAIAPEYVLCTTNVIGERRFLSSIARRLRQMGSLTNGERDASGSGIISADMDLENKYANQAVLELFQTHFYRDSTNGFNKFCEKLGFANYDENGLPVTTLRSAKSPLELDPGLVPESTKLLNRILALNIADQEEVFNEFFDIMQSTIEAAISEGTFDNGTQDIKVALRAQSVKIKNRIHLEEENNKKLDLLEVDIGMNTSKLPFANAVKLVSMTRPSSWSEEQFNKDYNFFVLDNNNGRVYAVGRGADSVKNGVNTPRYKMWTTDRDKSGYTERRIVDSNTERFRRLTKEEAEVEWNKQLELEPYLRYGKHCFLTGVMLPNWHILANFADNPKIYRVQDSETGEKFIGTEVDSKYISDLLRHYGIKGASEAKSYAPIDIQNDIINNGKKYQTLDGKSLSRRMMNSRYLIKMVMPGFTEKRMKELEDEGLVYTTKTPGKGWEMFIPYDSQNRTNADGMTRFLQRFPIKMDEGESTQWSSAKIEKQLRENVLSGDDVRATMPGYNPADWHTHVDRTGYVGAIMNERFEKLLATRKGKGYFDNKGRVIFLAGGNGVGKSTVSNKLVKAPPDFIIDSTLGNLDVARKQISRIIANGQKPHIYFVYRTPEQALINIQRRIDNGGHTVSPKSFADSHTNPLRNLPLLAEEFGDKLTIQIFDYSDNNNGSEISLKELEKKGIPDHEQIRTNATSLRSFTGIRSESTEMGRGNDTQSISRRGSEISQANDTEVQWSSAKLDAFLEEYGEEFTGTFDLEDMKKWREENKRPPIRDPKPMTLQGMQEAGMYLGSNEREMERLASVGARNAMNLTHAEIGGLHEYFRKLSHQRVDLAESVHEAVRENNLEAAQQIGAELALLDAKIDDIQMTQRLAASEWGRAGLQRRFIKNLLDGTLLGLKQELKAAYKRELTEEEAQDAERLYNALKQSQGELDEATIEACEKFLREDFRKVVKAREGKVKLPSKELAGIERAYDKAINAIIVHSHRSGATLVGLPNARKHMTALLTYHVELANQLGQRHEDQYYLDCIKEDLKDIVEVTDWEIRQAITSYGNTIELPNSVTDKMTRDLVHRFRNMQKLEDIANKIAPEVTGILPDKQTLENRESDRMVREAMAELYAENPSLFKDDDKKHLKAQQEAMIHAWENKIEQLRDAIARREKIQQREGGVKYTEEMKILKAELDRVRQLYKETFPPTAEEEMAKKINRVIGGLTRELDKLTSIDDQLNALKAQYDSALARGDAKAADAAKARMAKILTRTEKELLTNGDIEDLRRQIAEKRAEKAAMEALMFPAGTPQRVKKMIESRKIALEKTIAENDRKIFERDILPKSKEKSALRLAIENDPEIIELTKRRNQQSNKIRHMRTEAMRKGQPFNEYGRLDKVRHALAATMPLRTMLDLSATLRQAGVLAMGHPVLAARGLAESVKAMLSDKNADILTQHLISKEDWDEFVSLGGKLYKTSDIIEGETPEEYKASEDEPFTINGKPWGIHHIPGVKASERSFGHFLNFMRLHVYKELKSSPAWGKTGPSINQKKVIIKNLHSWTGRGLDNTRGEDILQTIFWAPKLAIAGLKLATPLGVLLDVYRAPNTTVDTFSYEERKVARNVLLAHWGRCMGSAVAITMIANAIAKILSGDDDEDWADRFAQVLDPRSSQFMGIKIGNSCIGVASIVTQFYNLAAKLITGEKRTPDGSIKRADKFTELGRFTVGKLNPVISASLDLLTRKTYDGKKLTMFPKGEDEKQILLHMMESIACPLTFTDLYKNFKENDFWESVVVAPLIILGGVKYTMDAKTDYERLSVPFNSVKNRYKKVLKEGNYDEIKSIREEHPEVKYYKDFDNRSKVINKLTKAIEQAKESGNAKRIATLEKELEKRQADFINVLRQRKVK